MEQDIFEAEHLPELDHKHVSLLMAQNTNMCVVVVVVVLPPTDRHQPDRKKGVVEKCG